MRVQTRKARTRRSGGRLRRIVRWLLLIVVLFYGVVAVSLAALKWLPPLTTAVQVQRRVEALFSGTAYTKRVERVPLSRISPALQHAVIAAEDARFYQHRGIDWKEVRDTAEDSLEEGRVSRGASTLTQQLVKNLFLTTHGGPVRKAVEWTLAPMAEFILGKQRILELYLNTAEWGPGVFGAEAAAKYHYGASAARLDRDRAARLAAVLPNPRRRKPARMGQYASEIQTRMRQMGW